MARSRPRKSSTRSSSRSYPSGIIHVTPAGYGFVQTAVGEYFIPASKTADAFDGDTVEVSTLRDSFTSKNKVQRNAAGRLTARVVRVIHRAHDSIVGSYEIAEPFGIVVPEDPCIHHDIFTQRDSQCEIKDGDIVRVKILSYPNRREPAFGVVEEVLGHKGIEGIDIELIIAQYKLSTHFSQEALDQAQQACVDSQEALAHQSYRDIRNRLIFTIDPQDARDFDDALSYEYTGTYHRLGVHIADVSYYVPWNSPLDIQARQRATSVYLVDRVIPMLPEKLCNEICSLQPHCERRTLSVDLYFDDAFRLHHIDVYPAIICSSARLSYQEVQRFLDGISNLDSVDSNKREHIAYAISSIHRLSKQLFASRVQRGGIDFESVEARVVLDDKKTPVDVSLRTKTDATSLVEESMIAANEAIAQFLLDNKMPGIFRVHDVPELDELKGLVPLLQEFGYSSDVSLSAFSAGDPFEIQKVLRLAQGRTEEYLLSSLILRCMQRAIYRPECLPHFGLASNAYTHFTSPIRRYPDLVVHRMVKMALFSRSETYQQQVDSLSYVSEHSSKMERNAEAASRDSQELKLLEYMEQFIGQEFDGIISGMNASGFFVSLENTAEGFVSLRSYGEYFMYDVLKHQLTGSDSGQRFRLGQVVRIRIHSVKPYERRADFQLVH